MNKKYFANVDESNSQEVIGKNEGMTGDELMLAVVEFRLNAANRYRPINVSDENGLVLFRS